MAETGRRPRKIVHKADLSDEELIELIDPPSAKVRPYNPAIMEAIQRRSEKDQAARQSYLERLQKQLYREVFPWWVSEIENAAPCDETYDDRIAAIMQKADEEWEKLSGLPPLTTWNSLHWRKAAMLARYSGDDEEKIVDSLIVHFTSCIKPDSQKTEEKKSIAPFTANDARGEWIYNESTKDTPWQVISDKLKKKPKTWARVGPDGCRKIAIRYARKNNLPLPKKRKQGRPTKKSKK